MILSTILLLGATITPHYDVQARIDRAKGTVAVAVKLTLPDAAEKTDLILGDTYAIEQVKPGRTASAELQKADENGFQHIVVQRKKASGPVTLDLRYQGPLADTGTPPMNLIGEDLVELNLDSVWLPVVAGFHTHFTVDATITGIPEELVAVAAGSVKQAGNTVRIQRKTPDVDLAFAAMRGLKKSAEGDFELYAVDLQSPTASLYRKHGAAALQFLQQWFGPMPGRPVRVAVVRRERESGYARRGYIVVTERSGDSETGIGKFIAHEMAHAWWAPVDPTSEHRWLQESVAEYVSLRYVESAFGVEARDAVLARKRELAAKATPILGLGKRTEIELYAKGPVLLFDLEERIGREKLDQVFRNLAPHPPRVSSEMFDALAAVAGADVAKDFERRLRE